MNCVFTFTQIWNPFFNEKSNQFPFLFNQKKKKKKSQKKNEFSHNITFKTKQNLRFFPRQSWYIFYKKLLSLLIFHFNCFRFIQFVAAHFLFCFLFSFFAFKNIERDFSNKISVVTLINIALMPYTQLTSLMCKIKYLFHEHRNAMSAKLEQWRKTCHGLVSCQTKNES